TPFYYYDKKYHNGPKADAMLPADIQQEIVKVNAARTRLRRRHQALQAKLLDKRIQLFFRTVRHGARVSRRSHLHTQATGQGAAQSLNSSFQRIILWRNTQPSLTVRIGRSTREGVNNLSSERQ